jgi:hypothetical protein
VYSSRREGAAHAEEIVFLSDEHEKNFQQKIISVTEKVLGIRDLALVIISTLQN